MPRVTSIQELRREIQKREVMLGKLQAKRQKLVVRLSALDRRIAAISGETVAGVSRGKPGPKPGRKPGSRRRGRRGKPLIDFAKQVLEGSSGMRVKDVAQAVKAAGYKTGSKDFYTIVATLLRDKRNFKKLKRGVYRLA